MFIILTYDVKQNLPFPIGIDTGKQFFITIRIVFPLPFPIGNNNMINHNPRIKKSEIGIVVPISDFYIVQNESANYFFNSFLYL